MTLSKYGSLLPLEVEGGSYCRSSAPGQGGLVGQTVPCSPGRVQQWLVVLVLTQAIVQ